MEIIKKIIIFILLSLNLYAINYDEEAKFVALSDGRIIRTAYKDVVRPIASLTKVMNILVTLDEIEKGNIHLDDKLTFDRETYAIQGGALRVWIGDTYTLEELLKAELVFSSNNSAYLVAKYVGQGSIDRFVEMMNEKAKELGMKNTRFGSPAGLPSYMTKRPMDVSTPSDLFIMTKEALNHPEIFKWVNNKQLILKGHEGHEDIYVNRNPLIGQKNIIGLKTGFHNQAGFNIITVSQIHDIYGISITLNTWDPKYRNKEQVKEIEYINNLIEKVANEHDYKTKLYISNSEKQYIYASIEKDVYDVEIGKELKGYINIYEDKLDGNIYKGDVLGEIIFYRNGIKIKSVNIVSEEESKEIGYLHKLWRKIKIW